MQLIAKPKRHASRRRVDAFVLAGFALLLAILSSCATSSPSPDAKKRQSAIELASCKFAKFKEAVLCGKHEVYENRAAKAGRKIPLRIVVLPARSAEAKGDPVFFLAGGPGQGAARMASVGEDALMRALRRDRDLVYVDLRGTGDSNGLQCRFPAERAHLQSFFAELFDAGTVQACRENLEARADLRFYTTPLAVEDLEELRSALGYDKINLYGVSYGTLAALEYLRRYPTAVRAAVLAGVITPTAKFPLQLANGGQKALARLFADCAAEETCAMAFPNLADKFAKLVEALKAGPITFDAPHPVSKDIHKVKLSHGTFGRQLLSLLNSHNTASLLPLVISNAAQGNWSPYVQVLTGTRMATEFTVDTGAYFTIVCSESIPVIDAGDVRATAGTFMDEYPVRRLQQACLHWPRGEVSQDFYQPSNAPTPVLMLSGDIDPSTPPEIAAQALKSLANGRQVLLRNTPHDYSSGCERDLIAAFIARGSAHGLNSGCAARLRRPPFATALPASYNR